MQAARRGIMARREIDEQHKKQHNAVVKMQAVQRGKNVRTEIDEQHKKQHNTAVKELKKNPDFSKTIDDLEREGIIEDIETKIWINLKLDKALMLIREAYFKNHKTNKEKKEIPKGKMLNEIYTFNALEYLKEMIVKNGKGHLVITEIEDSEFKIIDYDFNGSLENSTLFFGGKLLLASWRENITTTWMEILKHARSSYYITDKEYFDSVAELTDKQKQNATKAWKLSTKVLDDVREERGRENRVTPKMKMNAVEVNDPLIDSSKATKDAEMVNNAAGEILGKPLQLDEIELAKDKPEDKPEKYQLPGKSSRSLVFKDAETGEFFPQASKKKGGGKKTKKTKKIKKNKKIKKIKKSKKQKKNKKNITLNRKTSKYLIK